MNKTKLLVAIPLYAGIYARSQANLANMLLHTQRTYPNMQIDVYCTDRQLIYRAREAIRRVALRGKYDYVYWQDEDILVKHNTLVKLLKREVEAVGALYFGRYPLYNPMIFEKIDKSPRYKSAKEYPQNMLLEVDATGLGCALTSNEVLASAGDGSFRSMNDRGEDINFWHCVQEAGHKIYVDTANKVGHISERETVIDENFRAIKLCNALKNSTWDVAKINSPTIST